MLGDEIRKARRKAGVTQEELAFRAGISRQYVSLLELGRKSPTVFVLLRTESRATHFPLGDCGRHLRGPFLTDTCPAQATRWTRKINVPRFGKENRAGLRDAPRRDDDQWPHNSPSKQTARPSSRKRNVTLLPLGLNVGLPGLLDRLAIARRNGADSADQQSLLQTTKRDSRTVDADRSPLACQSISGTSLAVRGAAVVTAATTASTPSS